MPIYNPNDEPRWLPVYEAKRRVVFRKKSIVLVTVQREKEVEIFRGILKPRVDTTIYENLLS